MRTLRIVLGDQCSHGLSALRDMAPGDLVLMAEVMDECTYVKHHPKKIVLVLSAMRHFAAELRARGLAVRYVALDEPGNTGSLRGEMLRALEAGRFDRIVLTEPGEWRLLEEFRHWHELTKLDVEIRDDDRFLCRVQEFRTWATRRRGMRMEFFYREMRQRHRILMDENGPAGGQWNFDPENRKPLPKRVSAPPVPRYQPDAITAAVIGLVRERFSSHFGDLDDFAFPVTAAQAQEALDVFIRDRLPLFGDWQDAMKTGEPILFHGHVSMAINAGLLLPLEVCRAAEAAYRSGAAPINAAEGFIRQILGWREYVRGVYWWKMPEYGRLNALGATRRLPWFYWSGETRMNCLAQSIGDTKAHAYAHHIQRLMVIGNFALLAGFHPDDVDEWYLVVYADAYQWVEMPNVRGMALHGDGGIMGSKPYAGSGAYINRMSDYCRSCHYDVKDATGERGCPFNALYWDFMARHRERFAPNPRMAMPLRNLDRIGEARVAALRARAATLLVRMEAGELV